MNQFTSGVGLGINAGGGDDVLQFGNNGLAGSLVLRKISCLAKGVLMVWSYLLRKIRGN